MNVTKAEKLHNMHNNTEATTSKVFGKSLSPESRRVIQEIKDQAFRMIDPQDLKLQHATDVMKQVLVL